MSEPEVEPDVTPQGDDEQIDHPARWEVVMANSGTHWVSLNWTTAAKEQPE